MDAFMVISTKPYDLERPSIVVVMGCNFRRTTPHCFASVRLD